MYVCSAAKTLRDSDVTTMTKVEECIACSIRELVRVPGLIRDEYCGQNLICH